MRQDAWIFNGKEDKNVEWLQWTQKRDTTCCTARPRRHRCRRYRPCHRRRWWGFIHGDPTGITQGVHRSDNRNHRRHCRRKRVVPPRLARRRVRPGVRVTMCLPYRHPYQRHGRRRLAKRVVPARTIIMKIQSWSAARVSTSWRTSTWRRIRHGWRHWWGRGMIRAAVAVAVVGRWPSRSRRRTRTSTSSISQGWRRSVSRRTPWSGRSASPGTISRWHVTYCTSSPRNPPDQVQISDINRNECLGEYEALWTAYVQAVKSESQRSTFPSGSPSISPRLVPSSTALGCVTSIPRID